MDKRNFFLQSFRITVVSLALSLLSQETSFAQTPTPATSDVAMQTAKTLASEAVAQGIHVDLLDLKRTGGGSLTLKFAIVNDTKEQWNFLSLMPVSRVALLDLQNKKKYLVMTDSAGACVCSGVDHATVKPGTRETFWAKFQAPPEQVTKITVQMPSMPPFEDVSITQ